MNRALAPLEKYYPWGATHLVTNSRRCGWVSPTSRSNGAGPAPVCTFAGTSAARLTTAAQGDYFDNGSIQHVSHVIPDMRPRALPHRHRRQNFLVPPRRHRAFPLTELA